MRSASTEFASPSQFTSARFRATAAAGPAGGHPGCCFGGNPATNRRTCRASTAVTVPLQSTSPEMVPSWGVGVGAAAHCACRDFPLECCAPLDDASLGHPSWPAPVALVPTSSVSERRIPPAIKTHNAGPNRRTAPPLRPRFAPGRCERPQSSAIPEIVKRPGAWVAVWRSAA